MKLFNSKLMPCLFLLVEGVKAGTKGPIDSCTDQAPCLKFTQSVVEASPCSSASSSNESSCVVQVCMQYQDEGDCFKFGAISHICDGADPLGCPYVPADLDGSNSESPCTNTTLNDGKCSNVQPGSKFCQFAKPGDTVFFAVKDGNYRGGTMPSPFVKQIGDEISCEAKIECNVASATQVGSCGNVSAQLSKEMVWSYTIPPQSCSCTSTCPVGTRRTKVDFETDSSGMDLSHGDFASQLTPCVRVTARPGVGGNQDIHLPQIYDSNTTGGADPDLEIGIGNLLIIQENNTRLVPDDNAGGGFIVFRFCEPIVVKSVALVDNQERATLAFVRSDSLDSRIQFPPIGDGLWEELAVEQDTVDLLRIRFRGAGGVAFITACLPLSVES